MAFVEAWIAGMQRMTPLLLIMPLLLIPFIVAEQFRPAQRRPGPRDYVFNALIAITSAYLTLPLSMAIGIASGSLRPLLPWAPLALSVDGLAALPLVGPALKMAVVVLASLFLHDFWFYWAHRLEHRIPLLWEFHKLHHSDELMNASTWARDHFLQSAWRALWPAFAVGMLFDLSPLEAGTAGMIANLVLIFLSMFYHSAIRVQLPWLDQIVVTPQVHRIHHSVDPVHHNCNYADALPVFDIVFGTYRRPQRAEFPHTGLGAGHPAPRSLWRAQLDPVLAVIRSLRTRSGRRQSA